MRLRHAVLLLTSVALAGMPAADAAPRPITKAFAVQGTFPNPSPSGAMCGPSMTGLKDRHVEPFRAPAAGKLKVAVNGFYGDFDIVITDDKGTVLAEGNNESSTSGLSPSTNSLTETAVYNARSARSLKIHVCNYLGSPDATGMYTFTYAR